MAKIKLSIDGYRCNVCSYEWLAKLKKVPIICPKCKSKKWNLTSESNNENNKGIFTSESNDFTSESKKDIDKERLEIALQSAIARSDDAMIKIYKDKLNK